MGVKRPSSGHRAHRRSPKYQALECLPHLGLSKVDRKTDESGYGVMVNREYQPQLMQTTHGCSDAGEKNS